MSRSQTSKVGITYCLERKKGNIQNRLLDLEVPHKSVLLLYLSHLVSELGADGPDGGVQLLHARSVCLVISYRKFAFVYFYLSIRIPLTHLQSFLQHFGRLRYPC